MRFLCYFKTMKFFSLALALVLTTLPVLIPGDASAASKGEINASVKASMDRFKSDVKGSSEYLKLAQGILVLPNITKAGFVVGGQYGVGALQIKGETVGYYNLAGASLGYQIGAEKFDLIILFITDEALKKFRSSEGWEAGADADVAIVDVGKEFSAETLRSQSSVLGFVFDQKGLMAGVSIKGAKFSKIKP